MPNIRTVPPTILLAAALPFSAQADIASTDVWNNLSAYVGVFGGTLNASMSTSGSTTSASGVVARFNLPMGIGSIAFGAGDMTLVDNGDGSVSLQVPNEVGYSIELDIAGEGSGTIAFTLTAKDYHTIASGDPGDITYTYSIDTYGLDFSSLRFSGELFEDPEFREIASGFITGGFSANGTHGRYRVTEGDLLTVTSAMSYDSYSYDLRFDTGDGAQTTAKGLGGLTRVNGDMAFPPNMSILNLPGALRNGLSLVASSSAAAADSSQKTMMGGQPFMEQVVSIGQTTADVRFDKSGIGMDFQADDYSIAVSDIPEFPLPIQATIDAVSAGFEVPLLASDTPQDLNFRNDLAGVSIDDGLWSIFDPGAVLPRDPATLRMDLRAKASTFIDLLDFVAMSSLGSSQEVPFELNALSIEDIHLSFAGAKFSGNGSFTFDNSDLVTFDGIPAPTGAMDLTLVGGNGLLDSLVSMGFVPEEDAMGARMMLGLFARPGGEEDSLVSRIEIEGATGAISANGQRLQ